MLNKISLLKDKKCSPFSYLMVYVQALKDVMIKMKTLEHINGVKTACTGRSVAIILEANQKNQIKFRFITDFVLNS